jgi:hypothetical protein
VPGIDLTNIGITKDDPRLGAIDDVLTDSISRALEISANASVSASFSKEAAIVYSIDLIVDGAATNAAPDAAMDGDRSRLATLKTATELRNALGDKEERKFMLSVNLLRLFTMSPSRISSASHKLCVTLKMAQLQLQTSRLPQELRPPLHLTLLTQRSCAE